MQLKKPIVFVILDGYGYSPNKKYNAIAKAKKPSLNYLFKHYPDTLLKASGKSVGLPKNYIGNSEVGHLTIGSGRIISQPVTQINKAIDDDSFFKNKKLLNALDKIKKNNGRLHIIGLLSDAGVHCLEKHILAYINAALQSGIKEIYIHPILDGRDIPPQSAQKFLNKLDKFIKDKKDVKIGSIHGRFYAMDRDHNWERTKQSYDVLTKKQKIEYKNWKEVLEKNYKKNITDEFIPPTQLLNEAIVKPNDGIIFANFRPDRARQLTEVFIDKNFNDFDRKKIKLSCFTTPIGYDNDLKTIVLFPQKNIKNTLMDALAKNKLKTFSIAETEKYAHVTYFFRGGREEPLKTETQILVKSIPATNYIKQPCMSAKNITQEVLKALKSKKYNFYLINYANPDMVGHSGNLKATIKAIECLDKEIEKIYNEVIEKQNGSLIITADHGNAEVMFDEENNQPHTAHTSNPVPFVIIQKNLKDKKIKPSVKELKNIAPFILKGLNIKVPKEMD